MSPPNEIGGALRPVLDAFRKLGVAYRIGGSVASSALGVARATLDVDLVAALSPSLSRSFCEMLGHDFYVDEESVRDAAERRSCFNLIHLATMIKVDVFVLKTGSFDLASFARVRHESLGSLQDVSFCTAEDVILRKLQWYCDGGQVSERQWSDVIGLLRVQQGSLDWVYLDRWSAELGLVALLARARRESETP